MECAITVFARRGIGRAGHTEIAELAQVSVATVFNYFNTRDALVNDVLAEVARFFKALAQSAYQNEPSFPRALRRHMELLVEAIYHRPDYIAIWMEWGASLRDQSWPRFQQLMQELIALAAQTGNRQEPPSLSLEDSLWLLNTLIVSLAQKANIPGTADDQQALLETARRWVDAILIKP